MIWDLLGLRIRPVTTPFRTKKPEQEKVVNDTPDNIVYHSGRAFVQTEDIGTMTVEDTRYAGQGQRDAAIGQADELAVIKYSLDGERYRTLKPYWAAGISARQTARSFRGKRGYSPRTLDVYWKAFAEAQPLPQGTR